MDFIECLTDGNIATVRLNRGKVNALNMQLLDELKECLESIKTDDSINAIILTGSGKFFSFGFDIPEFLDYPRDKFKIFIDKFTALYSYMFMYPKPLLAAINGHAIAGGCMLATTCDYRLMVEGRAKISLNEVAFGSTVFAGSVEMLKFCVGDRNAETILITGKMFDVKEALELGLIDKICTEENLIPEIVSIAKEYAQKIPNVFKSAKYLLRTPVTAKMQENEAASIEEFLNIWYSEPTRSNLKNIKIY